MPPRRAHGNGQLATQTQANPVAHGAGPSGAGPSVSDAVLPDYVTFTLGQAIIAEGCLPEGVVKAMVRRLAQRNTDDAYSSVLSKLQRDAAFLGVDIKRIKFPWNGEWFVCLVDKEKDDASKSMCSKFNPEQVLYYRSVVEALCEAQPEGNRLLGSLSQIVLKNVDVGRLQQQASQSAAAARASKLSQMDKEVALKDFAQDGWLYQPQQGYYTIGPRALSELKDWILSLLPTTIAERLHADYM